MVVEPILPYRSVMTRYKDVYSPTQTNYLKRGNMSTRNQSQEISRSLFELSKLTSRSGTRNAIREGIQTRAESKKSHLRLSDLKTGNTMMRFNHLRSEAQIKSLNSTQIGFNTFLAQPPNVTFQQQQLKEQNRVQYLNKTDSTSLEPIEDRLELQQNKKITFQEKRQQIDRLLAKFQRDQMGHPNKFGFHDFQKFMRNFYGLKISNLKAIEVILYCRGHEMERSDNFDRNKLLDWIQTQFPNLNRIHQAQIDSKNEHHEHLKSGRARFSRIQKLKDIVQESDNQVSQEDAAMLGQMAACQRVSQREKNLEAKRNSEIQALVFQLAKQDTATKAFQFENCATKTWSENPNVKLFNPLIKKEDRSRINQLLTQRLKF